MHLHTIKACHILSFFVQCFFFFTLAMFFVGIRHKNEIVITTKSKEEPTKKKKGTGLSRIKSLKGGILED